MRNSRFQQHWYWSLPWLFFGFGFCLSLFNQSGKDELQEIIFLSLSFYDQLFFAQLKYFLMMFVVADLRMVVADTVHAELSCPLHPNLLTDQWPGAQLSSCWHCSPSPEPLSPGTSQSQAAAALSATQPTNERALRERRDGSIGRQQFSDQVKICAWCSIQTTAAIALTSPANHHQLHSELQLTSHLDILPHNTTNLK